MGRTYQEIRDNEAYEGTEWEVTINGNDYTSNLELVEFRETINKPLEFTLKTSGISGGNTDVVKNKEVVVKYGGELFRGLIQQVDSGNNLEATIKGAGYASTLDGESSKNDSTPEEYTDSNTDTIVSDLTGSFTVGTNTRLNSNDNTVDFRANKTQLEDLNRLIGEYEGEWFVDANGGNPEFNVVQQRGGGSSVKTFSTVDGDNTSQTANAINRNVNTNEGDFDGVKVFGYGDGNDQIVATAGSVGKDNKVLIYTDKTIISQRQADQRATSLQNNHTVEWEEIKIEPTDPNELFDCGDVVTVNDKATKIDGEDFRVVERFYKIDYRGNVSSTLTLSNKPQTFTAKFKEQENTTKSQTDHMQGARNVWSDKESANATEQDSLEIDFEVPQDVVDLAGNNRLDRIEFNYACTPYRQSGDPQDVTADNFDPGVKQVDTSVNPGGVEVESENVKKHNHPVGSSTSRGAQQAQRIFESTFTNQSVVGWTELGGEDFAVINPEEDLEHTFQVELTDVRDSGGNPITKDIHFAVLAETDDTLSPDFSFSPSSPAVGDTVTFVDTTDHDPLFVWHWRIEDSGGTAVKSGFGRDIEYVFENSGTYTTILTVNGAGETVINNADSSSNEFTAQNDLTSYLQNGDSVRVLRSDGNNGTYTISSYNTDGNGNTVISVDEDIPFSYSSGDSLGVIQFKIPPSGSSEAATVSKDVTVSSISSSDVSEMSAEEVKKYFDKPEEELLVLRDGVDVDIESIGAQDASSLQTAWKIDNDLGYIVTNPSSVYTEYSIGPEFVDYDDGCSSVDIEWFRQKDKDTAIFEFQNEQTSDLCELSQFLGFETFEIDDSTPFNGVGKYSFSARFNSSTLDNVVRYSGGPDDDTIDANGFARIASCIVEDHDSNVNPDGDDRTEVEFTVDGWYGEGVTDFRIVAGEDDGTLSGSNETEVYSESIEGWTVELRPGQSRTVTIDGENHTIELVDTSSGFIDPEAELIVDGNNEGNFEKGDVVVEEDFDEKQLRVRKVIHNYDITDRDGNDTGTDYSSVVLETYANNLDRDVADSFYDSEGDYVATWRFQSTETTTGGPGNDIEGGLNTPFADEHSTSFTISLNEAPNAAFSYSPSQPTIDDTIYFTDESSDPDSGDSIDKWEWDFGDGTTETINSAPGDTSHKYSTSGNYTVELTVTDTNGATDTTSQTVSVGTTDSSLNNPQTRSYETVAEAGSSISSQLTSSLNSPQTRTYESVASVGAQQSPGAGGEFCDITLDVARRELSDRYEVIAAAADGTDLQLSGRVQLIRKNHTHDIPRQDDFDGKDPAAGAGAENKEIPFQKSTSNRGDVNLDFSANDETIELDTTLNSNDVTITVANEDSNGNLTNTAQITANDGTASTTNTYQDAELYIRIDSASDSENFKVRDGGFGDTEYTLAAITAESFQSNKTAQEREDVSDGDGSEQDVVEGVDSSLLTGSTANNVRIFIDDDPDSGTNTEQEITGDFYSNDTDGDGNIDSGTPKDKELDISQYVDSPGWYRLRVEPDQPSFIKSRVFLDHHKDTE